ncbi:MAG TPA: 1-deoxy-D-xylulose-5-phosphate reductoisomerase [bacterium]|nr:1-deoxy-D-xylulose-5-phosphate reductoisomerase [bacterium]HPS30391.1 1-deoxy-D-xylulose-5-phosphate reductoisomerase [bacterium]
MASEKIIIFGITGSIGTNSEKIIYAFKDRFEIVGCSAGSNIAGLNQMLSRHPKIKSVVVKDSEDIIKVDKIDGNVSAGRNALFELLDLKPDKIIMALPGKEGWKITVEAVKRGIPVCLANKESLVIAGFFLGNAVTSDRSKIIPIDSEHAALMQLIEKTPSCQIKKVFITASGGALRDMSIDEMLNSDAAQALKHPVWNMGAKVTVDSATMLNKGLELIEAFWLFNIAPEKLGVIVHPEVDIHAALILKDGSSISQIAPSSMMIPIASALSYPEMLPVTEKFPELEFCYSGKNMRFMDPDFNKYPLLKKAFDMLIAEDFSGMVAFAISDEVAVSKFLRGEIKVKGIHEIVLKSVDRFGNLPSPETINDIDKFIDDIEKFANGCY